jgi:hypothetical protein
MMAVVPVFVSVRCPAGCSGCARPGPAPLWAVLSGTGQVEWADVSVLEPAPGTGEVFLRAVVPPLPGEERVVKVHGPFSADDRAPFWAFFAPALAAVNGLDDFPEGMRDCAMVACTPLAVLAQGDGLAWLRVRVEEVMRAADAARTLRPSAAGSLEDLLPPPGIPVMSRLASRGRLRYCNWFTEGGAGSWAVCSEDGQGMALLLCGEWWFHREDVALGHRPLSQAEAGLLRAAWPGSR